jgi:hypothetical protein
MIGSSIIRATFRGSLREGADGERIDRLAASSATRPPEGVVLLAELEGEPVAAVGLFDRHTVEDPPRSNLGLRMRLHLLRLQVLVIVSLRGF